MIVSNKVTILGKSLLTSTALVAGFVAVSVSAQAAPVITPVVTGTFTEDGAGTFTNTKNLTTITVHQNNTIANFNEYNIGEKQGVHYQHDLKTTGGNVNHLSRVTGGSESRILGKLTSDRVNITLINPNGIFVGKNGSFNVPSIIATTSDISDADYKAGKYNFKSAELDEDIEAKGKNDPKFVNNGTITIQEGGLGVFVAPGVENNGVIIADEGKVVLAAGEDFTLDMYGDKLITFAVDKADRDRYVKQSGKIIAKGGSVLLTTQDADSIVKNSINQTGYIEANTVTITANDIVLGRSSEIVAKGKPTKDEQDTESSENRRPIKPKTSTDGGTIIVKAKNTLVANGDLIATGSGANGDGGFIETSAKELYLETGLFGLNIDTSADNGNHGEWLIDPSNFTIGAGFGGANFINNIALSFFLINNNITLQTNPLGVQDGDINVNASVIKVLGSKTQLALIAADDININAGVTIGAIGTRKLDVVLSAQDDVINNGTVSTNGGNFTVGKDPVYTGPAVSGVTGLSDRFVNNGVLNTGSGDVNINAKIITVNTAISGHDITLNTGATGRVELDAKLNGNTLSSDTLRVDVISDNATIQQGVELVNATGVVNLGADTFNQSVLLNKDISLVGGALGGESILAPTSQAKLTNEFRSSYDWNEQNKSIILVQNANANIQDITIDGSGVTTGFLNTPTEFERLVGIGYDNAGGTVDNVKVKNIFDDAKDLSTGIFADSNSTFNDKSANPALVGVTVASSDVARTVTVENSDIENYEFKGISANGNLLTATIDDNNVKSADAKIGVELRRGAKGSVINNTIDNDSSSLAFFAGNSSDILLDRAGDGVLVDNNTMIAGNGLGIGVQVINTNEATVSNNDIQNERTGVLLVSTNDDIVDNNNIQNNSDGVIAMFANRNDITNNNITDNSNSGATLFLSNDNDLKDNNVRRNGDGIYIVASQGNLVARNDIINNDNAGVKLENSDNNTIRNNEITRNTDGVVLLNSDSNKIRNNNASNNRDDGIALTDSNHNTVSGNTANNNRGDGIDLESSNSNTISLNTTNSNSDDGIDLTDSERNVLDGNTALRNADNGIVLRISDNNEIKNNTASNNRDDGIELTDSNRNTVSGNQANNNRDDGIDLNSSNNNTISLNTTNDNSNDGIELTNSERNVLDGNIALRNSDNGIELRNSDNNDIKNSTANNNGNDGISLRDSNRNTVDGNIALRNSDNGIELRNSDNNDIKNSTANNNGNDGISLTDSNRNKVISNTANNNDEDGIDLNSSNNNEITTNTTNSNSNDGIDIADSERNVLDGNIALRNSDNGIELRNSDNNDLLNNISTNNGNAGISLSSSDNNDLTDNDIRRNAEGVYIFGSTGNLVARNDIINNDNAGVRLEQSTDNTLRNNDINRNTDGVVLNDSDSNRLINNDIKNNSNYGVSIVSSDNNSSERDTITGNGTAGVYISDSDNTSITDALIENNGVGIDILNGSDNTSIIDTIINDGDIGLRVDGDKGPITLTMNNVIFGGIQTDSAITFQNATTVDGVVVTDVQLLSDAPVGWKFVNVEGGPVTDVLDAGDMNFGNTVFGDTYSVADIQLTNSPMDGDASGVTFVNDAGDPFAREARVFHTLDSSPEGTIFYNGLSTVIGGNFGNLFGNIARRTDLREVYYNPLSTAGLTFDTPSIEGVAQASNFNATNEFRVSLSGGEGAAAPVQVASNASASDLNELETAATGGAAGEDLNELETAAGGEAGTCGTNFANDFLGEEVLLANASGACSTGNQAQAQ